MPRRKKWGRKGHSKRQHSKGSKRPRSWHRKSKRSVWAINEKLRKQRKRQPPPKNDGNDEQATA